MKRTNFLSNLDATDILLTLKTLSQFKPMDAGIIVSVKNLYHSLEYKVALDSLKGDASYIN